MRSKANRPVRISEARLFYLLDLLGVAVFAVSGALAAGHAAFQAFGVIVIAGVASVGGGTLRDLLLNRHPIFWIRDPLYLTVIVASAILTMAIAQRYPPHGHLLIYFDAVGLALFSMTGAEIAEEMKLSPIAIVLMGTVSATAGGMVRDVLTARVPFVFHSEIYATAAIVGVILYLLFRALRVDRAWAFGAGMATVALLRFSAILWGWHLPVFAL